MLDEGGNSWPQRPPYDSAQTESVLSSGSYVANLGTVSIEVSPNRNKYSLSEVRRTSHTADAAFPVELAVLLVVEHYIFPLRSKVS